MALLSWLAAAGIVSLCVLYMNHAHTLSQNGLELHQQQHKNKQQRGEDALHTAPNSWICIESFATGTRARPFPIMRPNADVGEVIQTKICIYKSVVTKQNYSRWPSTSTFRCDGAGTCVSLTIIQQTHFTHISTVSQFFFSHVFNDILPTTESNISTHKNNYREMPEQCN